MKIYFVGLIALRGGNRGRLSAVVGHYHYQDYAATLADGRVIKLQRAGSKKNNVLTLEWSGEQTNRVYEAGRFVVERVQELR